MKALKKFALLGLVAPLLLSVLTISKAVAGSDILIIRVYESKMIIATKDKATEVPLDKSINRNLVILSQTLEDYYKEGYKLESSNAMYAATYGGGTITTYILTK